MVQLIALALISLGAYLLIVRYSFVPNLLGEIAYINHFLLFAVGILLIATCIVGFLGAANGDSCLLLTVKWLAGRLRYTLQERYSRGYNDVDRAVDLVQQKFKCCGSKTYHDWKSSVFQNSSKEDALDLFGYGLRVPDSCYLSPTVRFRSLLNPNPEAKRHLLYLMALCISSCLVSRVNSICSHTSAAKKRTHEGFAVN
ncbi:unnamed protein product [Echinostoma caproni]|uniref:Tetraspanin n=1 Tax=Echinostoma caproni TaxID=27848 RepID=A0A183AX52_9TREM|nr:unnamed protein product [Echinostoma caproni]